jgi:hypothetical protein
MTTPRRLADRVTALASSVDFSGFTPFFAPLMFFLNEKGKGAARVDTRGDTPRVSEFCGGLDVSRTVRASNSQTQWARRKAST